MYLYRYIKLNCLSVDFINMYISKVIGKFRLRSQTYHFLGGGGGLSVCCWNRHRKDYMRTKSRPKISDFSHSETKSIFSKHRKSCKISQSTKHLIL